MEGDGGVVNFCDGEADAINSNGVAVLGVNGKLRCFDVECGRSFWFVVEELYHGATALYDTTKHVGECGRRGTGGGGKGR